MLTNSNLNNIINNNNNNNNNNDNNREDEFKAKDGVKAEDDVGYIYIDDEYKDLIGKIFKYGLTNRDLHLSNFDNRQLG